MLSIKSYVGSCTPQMPQFRWTPAAQIVASAVAHAIAASTVLLVMKPVVVPAAQASPSNPQFLQPVDVRQIVFIPREPQARGGGGGGGGSRQAGPIRRAHGIGSDAITLRAATPARPTEVVRESAPPEPILLDAKPLVSGLFDQIGLPDGGVEQGTSTGPGSGGGAGTDTGTGSGPGQGPGIGQGSRGGIGGEIYRPGGAVSTPRVLVEVKPAYTTNALRLRIEGTVLLELVVTREGRPSQIRVIRSLDRELDQQAVTAAGRWRFEPGRLAATPVDVLVTLMLDFRIR